MPAHLAFGLKIRFMTIENQKTDLEYLSSTWHEKVKNIRLRAQRCKKNDTEHSPETPTSENAAEMPPDNELFTGPVHEELSAKQLFVGNRDFYKSLESAQLTGTTQPFDAGRVSTAQIGYKRFSFVQKALAAAIVLIAAVLLYAILTPPPEPHTQTVSATQQTLANEPRAEETVTTTLQQAKKPKFVFDPTQPLSLKAARTFYLNGDYDQALAVYEKLHKNLLANPKEDLMRDFLQLQMALCMGRTADYDQAGRLLRKIFKSNSNALKVIAYYHCSLLEMQKKQYLNARTKAYQAIALIDAIDFDKNWTLSLKRDCYFLAAQATTRKVLSLCDTDKDLPEDLWGVFGPAEEPFIGLDEKQLRAFLKSGSEQLNRAVLEPQVLQSNYQDGLTRYDITCNGTSVEELLARFAANSNIDLHWDSEAGKEGVRKRLVYLYLPSVTTPQFVTAAAGCAGLVARIDEKGVVNILNPAKYSYVSEHISFLSEEAVSLWQRFLLRFPADVRLATVHFALGLLHASNGQPAESIAEYKLVANRFSSSSLAPSALLNSSKLKNSLRDYADGREDLRQLVEQFPDTEIAGKAYLYLADTTAKASLKTEAARLYAKVYNLNLSSESQSAAALGAGKYSLQIGDYESAVKWLTQHIKLTKENKDVCPAYVLLGKAYLALENSKAACDAFQYALQGGPERLARGEYIETVSAMVEAHLRQGQFVQALDILEDIHSVSLSQKESIEILLLKSRVLRAMGLPDKAIATLGDRAEYVSDAELKARICFELSQCYIEKGSLNLAYRKLAEILVLTKSRPLTHEATLRLAEVCLQLGQNNQTISVCSQLLDLQPSEQIKQKTLDLLAMAYKQQENYDRAALALLGQWN